MLGVKSLIDPQCRVGASQGTYHQIVRMMWEAMERANAQDSVNKEENLCIALYAGKESEIDKWQPTEPFSVMV